MTPESIKLAGKSSIKKLLNLKNEKNKISLIKPDRKAIAFRIIVKFHKQRIYKKVRFNDIFCNLIFDRNLNILKQLIKCHTFLNQSKQ